MEKESVKVNAVAVFIFLTVNPVEDSIKGMNTQKYQSTVEAMQEKRRLKALKMKELWDNGWTLQKIGNRYRITRERVRQLLNYVRSPEENGGISIIAERNRKIRQEKLAIRREKRTQKSYGCSYEDYLAIRGENNWRRSPILAYRYQKRTAGTRGIGWELTLTEWWKIWQDSGKWGKRGRGAGYAMARNEDKGPYKVGNVHIVTNSENIKEAVAIRKANGKGWGTPRKPYCKRGHKLSGDNLRLRSDGQRACKACEKNRQILNRASAHEGI